MSEVWVGRVFGHDRRGGNHTAVLPGGAADPQGVARMLGFPDCASVIEHRGRTARVRTFSPVEELALCVQTSLATPVALGAAAGERWRVEHPGGALTVLVEQSGGSLVCWAHHSGERPPDPVEPATDLPGWLRVPGIVRVVRIAGARSRLYVEMEGAEAVDRLPSFDPDAMAELCRVAGCFGVVCFAPAPDVVRARVFTTSLQGGEDSATGGAVMGIGSLLAGTAGTRDVTVVQGPPQPSSQSRLLLRLGTPVLMGGRVEPLLMGTVAAP